MNEEWFDYWLLLNEASILNIGENSDFLEWTLMEGSERINDLSRQLRTFLNYKSVLIRHRYSKSPTNNIKTESKTYTKHGKVLLDLVSDYLFLLKKIGANEDNLSQKIQDIMHKTKFHAGSFEVEILKKVKVVGGSIWKEIHILSEIEHYNSSVQNVVFKTTKLLCSAESSFYRPFSTFYKELEENYTELEHENNNLLLNNRKEQNDVKSRQTKVKILE